MCLAFPWHCGTEAGTRGWHCVGSLAGTFVARETEAAGTVYHPASDEGAQGGNTR